MQPPPVKKAPQPTPKGSVDDRWTVRPGETFREFNARIREAGLSLPPGVPETLRSGVVERSEVPEVRPMKKFILQDEEESGNKTKRKRKEYLKQRKESGKRKRDDDSDFEGYERKRFRDVVKAPPVLRVAPKEALKVKERPPKLKKNPSLLPILKGHK